MGGDEIEVCTQVHKRPSEPRSQRLASNGKVGIQVVIAHPAQHVELGDEGDTHLAHLHGRTRTVHRGAEQTGFASGILGWKSEGRAQRDGCLTVGIRCVQRTRSKDQESPTRSFRLVAAGRVFMPMFLSGPRGLGGPRG